MLLWLQANGGTVLVCALLLAAVAAIVVNMVRDKRRGRSSCSHGCQNCALHGQCHRQ